MPFAFLLLPLCEVLIMDNSKQQQFRFMLFAMIALAILFGWSYLFPPPQKPVDEANTNANVEQTAANTAATPEVQATTQQTEIATTPDETPNKTVTIKTPYYQVKLDSKGALATSWILIKNKSLQGELMLYGDGSTKNDQKPLELVSQKAAEQTPRQLPFRLSTGDANTDNFLNERNYQVSAEREIIELADGQTQKIDFTLKDAATGIEAIKSFTFTADSYVSDLNVKLTKNGQTVTNTKLLIGSSIGDQSVPHYTFYKIAPEAIASVSDGTIHRMPGASFEYSGENAVKSYDGTVNWGGVTDSYFAMVAIPAQPLPGLEYHSSKYESEVEPHFPGIFSWITRNPTTKITKYLITAYVPINTNGAAPTKIYTGSKDHFVLSNLNLTNASGTAINIEDLVNYGWFHFLTKPLSIPILYALNFLYDFTHNFGIAIILFTLFFYSLLFPMRWYQSKSFKKAQKNAPKMKELQDELKDLQSKGVPNDDPRMRDLQMRQLKMTKDALPIGGCLPMLLQFPLLIALYVTVTISLGIRQADFLWLPDLSAGDPYHVLEFAFAFSMILSMKFSPQTAAITPEQQMQQKMMTYFMPVMMLYIMWSAPAGLLLYWFTGNVVMFVQQMVINRMNKTEDVPVVAVKEEKPEFTHKGKKKKGKKNL